MEDVSSECFAVTQQPPLLEKDLPVAPPAPADIIHNEDSGFIVTVWDDQTSTLENIQAFLARWPPSRTPVLYCNWIAVDRGGHQRHPADIPGLRASFESLKAAENVTVNEIDRIAHQYGVLSGKWLIYVDTEEIDELWGKIVRLLCRSEEGVNKGLAETRRRTPCHLCICR